MSLQEQIQTDLVSAMKAKDAQKLSVLRMLSSAIKNEQINAGSDLDDSKVLAVVQRQVKQLRDAQKDFTAGERADLVEKTTQELAVLEIYMPAQLSDDALRTIVQDAITAVGASSPADMGKVMGAAMKQAAGQADGGRVRDMVQALLK